MNPENQCTSTISTQPNGLQAHILQSLESSRYRNSIPIPLNTIQVAKQNSYLETLYHLKQLELNREVERVDYYPNPCLLLFPLLPLPLQLCFLSHHARKIYDPSTGEIRARGTHDFSLWAIAE